jgi:hypothetical protein
MFIWRKLAYRYRAELEEGAATWIESGSGRSGTDGSRKLISTEEQLQAPEKALSGNSIYARYSHVGVQ